MANRKQTLYVNTGDFDTGEHHIVCCMWKNSLFCSKWATFIPEKMCIKLLLMQIKFINIAELNWTIGWPPVALVKKSENHQSSATEHECFNHISVKSKTASFLENHQSHQASSWIPAPNPYLKKVDINEVFEVFILYPINPLGTVNVCIKFHGNPSIIYFTGPQMPTSDRH